MDPVPGPSDVTKKGTVGRLMGIFKKSWSKGEKKKNDS
jgi:hypothetical protein